METSCRRPLLRSTRRVRISSGSGWRWRRPSRCACPHIPGNASGCGHCATTDGRNQQPRASGGAEAVQSPSLLAEPAVAADVGIRPELTAPYVAPRTQLETDLVESWSAILRIKGIGIHDNFFELGGDSLQATILLNRLEEHLGEAVTGHVLFQVQTIGDLADYLRQHHPDAIRQRYDGEDVAPNGKPVGAAPRPDAAKDIHASDDVAIPRLARDDRAEELLARLDELSDAEVEVLLAKEAAKDGETRHD